MKRLKKSMAALVTLALVLGAAPALAAAQGVVNVNEASAEELVLLPRVGPVVAQRILEFRAENGPFESEEDLMLVRGIGERTFEQLRPYVTLEGKTTLEEKVRPERSEPSESTES